MIGFTSPALPKMAAPNGPLDLHSQTMFVTIATIGALFGCPSAGWLVEKLGRKNTLLASGAPFLVGNMLLFGCSTIPLLCLGRMLTGISGGMSTVVCPMYLAELSPKELRGMLGSGVQLAITIGILLVYLLGMFCEWRTLALFGAVIPMVAMAMAFKAPETPRFLMGQGRSTEAQRVVSWLRPAGSDISEELHDMEEPNAEKEEKASLGDLLTRPELLRPLCVSAVIMCLQQLTGINVVMFYTVSIFQSAGYEQHGELATVAIGATQVVMTVVACILMDRAGRRVLLSVGGIGMGAACAALSFYYRSLDAGEASGLSWLALLSLLVYIMAFSLGWGPIPMLIMSEIFPAKARGSASAVAAITSWGSAFLVTSQYSFLVSLIGMSGTFFFFAVFCFIGVLYVRVFVPETRGKSLEDIELYFLSKNSGRY
ncbi:hypothetical protein CAPTEDRAFT_158645 [Capitella teleta]|uniref:Major facilitator superfamily (MFS) profile domain-containing protein n=1 Tax=Capitella teleta TaxID=283909 RepID=R7U129_CAPTE|nr:hypothetical protein CAPTEDRAFT_158645 [Capitella teleta]|eukprot:ELT97336.1 hypothetical protein CAPTEDRAFT_158645 [Capitella teleta]